MPMKRSEQEFYPIQMDFLPDEFHQKAVTELNETPERLKVELKNLKELLSDSSHCDKILTEEKNMNPVTADRKLLDLSNEDQNFLKRAVAGRKSLDLRMRISFCFRHSPSKVTLMCDPRSYFAKSFLLCKCQR
ncbi:hypothetical protein AVEN_252911-1 [Araneus ventricosus]|uniref:Uncharacterized protein n=1 Tax=Araneus ventricosus TaxID=182803 RepID=A0A4Y2TJD0_ARAVE|nr:hypothetical protein AVEN_252911-1 [Araneus ventricosus]